MSYDKKTRRLTNLKICIFARGNLNRYKWKFKFKKIFKLFRNRILYLFVCILNRNSGIDLSIKVEFSMANSQFSSLLLQRNFTTYYRNFSSQNFHIILFREESQVSRHGYWVIVVRPSIDKRIGGKKEKKRKKKTKKERPEFFKRDHVAILLAIFTSSFYTILTGLKGGAVLSTNGLLVHLPLPRGADRGDRSRSCSI